MTLVFGETESGLALTPYDCDNARSSSLLSSCEFHLLLIRFPWIPIDALAVLKKEAPMFMPPTNSHPVSFPNDKV